MNRFIENTKQGQIKKNSSETKSYGGGADWFLNNIIICASDKFYDFIGNKIAV